MKVQYKVKLLDRTEMTVIRLIWWKKKSNSSDQRTSGIGTNQFCD